MKATCFLTIGLLAAWFAGEVLGADLAETNIGLGKKDEARAQILTEPPPTR